MSHFLPSRIDESVAPDVVVIGSGVAGMRAALGLAPRSIHLITRGPLGQGGSSRLAQGGVAAAVGGGDSPALHAADTHAASGGLSEPAVVDVLTRSGPQEIQRLEALGVRFDRERDGTYALALEGAHSRPRVLHCGGDRSGEELVRALVQRVSGEDSIAVFEDAEALELVVEEGTVVGVLARHGEDKLVLHRSRAVVLATGGLGHLFAHTTNAPESTGEGLAIAARAGALVADLEFVQFHPTALATGADPMPLVTEALRGAGATLIDRGGVPLMTASHPDGDLAPRDIVARAIWSRSQAGEGVYLDARNVMRHRGVERFPGVFELCLGHGVDPTLEPIPVLPAAHYHMGGVWTDTQGRASLPGLWACGEVASTGAHGANRLASNSLLEALVFGGGVAADVDAVLQSTSVPYRSRLEATVPTPARESFSGDRSASLTSELRQRMWTDLGLVRDRAGLERALSWAENRLEEGVDARFQRQLVVMRLVAWAALLRQESRGGHFRQDYPHSAGGPAWRIGLRIPDGREAVPSIEVCNLGDDESKAASAGRGEVAHD